MVCTMESPAYATPQAVANYFLDRAIAEGLPLTPMQINKLTYIAHGWVLAILHQPLFDEEVEAWQHGPVVPSLYHEFKRFGGSPITQHAVNYYASPDEFVRPTINETNPTLNQILSMVWNVYKGLSGGQLRALTHQPNSPWHQVYKEGQRSVGIGNDVIKRHYIELLHGMVKDVRS